jgi:hypothetical protein
MLFILDKDYTPSFQAEYHQKILVIEAVLRLNQNWGLFPVLIRLCRAAGEACEF